MAELRIGHGYDVHRLTAGRRLILGGVDIPWEEGLLGHSDADVLTHAVMDALLGAAGLGDIGKLFPDNDPAFAGISSLVRLHRGGGRLREEAGRGVTWTPPLWPNVLNWPDISHRCVKTSPSILEFPRSE